MKLDALDHPKTNHFASLLNISRPTAIGHLELLWAFTGKMAPQGNLGKWPDGAIARACDWMGDPKDFLEALLEARLLDRNEAHRLLVHDWHVHAAGWVRAKLKNAHQRFLTGASTSEATEDSTRVSSKESPRDPTIQGKGSEGKRESADAPTLTLVPAGPTLAKLPRPKTKKSSRAPADFKPDLEFARRELPDIDAEREAQKFRDWEFKTPKSDWPAAWRNWIGNCRDRGQYARVASLGRADNGLPYAN